jgi:glycosyltransferase involved in cell wall biosynthesis
MQSKGTDAANQLEDGNSPHGKAIVVSSVFSEDQLVAKLGREAYSYRFVFRAFAPLLKRWGHVSEITRPESRLDYALWRARQQHQAPLHFSFLPLHMMYLAQQAPNLAAPAWEFPDIPNAAFDNNPRNNWVAIAQRLSLIVTHSTFTRDAFLQAGVKTPIHVIPVPISDAYFAVPRWQPGQRSSVNCPAYLFPQADRVAPPANPWARERGTGFSLKGRAKQVYRSYLKRRLPRKVDKVLTFAADALRAAWQNHAQEAVISHTPSPRLELSGVVYTTIFNPFDPRKNWRDLLSAYLLALRDCEDATLVIKLVVCPELTAAGFNTVASYFQKLGISHRCKIAVVTDYLSDEEMVELAQASTYYLNASHAEGSCLPLQNFMAAGRPGLAPSHTALAEYAGEDVGFRIDSHPEPAAWPHDPQQRLLTTWHRLVWSSLHDQIKASYVLAAQNQKSYQSRADLGRERMIQFAGSAEIWRRLEKALNAVQSAAGTGSGTTPLRKAS